MRSRVLKSLPVSLIFYIQWIIVWHSSVLTVGVKCVGLFPTPFAARNGTQVPEMDRRDQYNFAENVRDQFFSRKKSASKVA